MAGGDFSAPIATQGLREVVTLLQALQSSLVKVVANVHSGSESVSAASAEIAQGNHGLSARTEQQASALEETAASMEQLSSPVRQNAESARQANQLVMSASTVAMQGAMWSAKVVQTMKGVNVASSKISDIISVIEASRLKPRFWHSMRPSKSPGLANRGEGLRWWRPRCAAWPGVLPTRPKKSSSSSKTVSSRKRRARCCSIAPEAP